MTRTDDAKSVGDVIPSHFEVIQVRVAEIKRLFKAIDPSPFNDKDLDENAEEFIVGWAKEAPSEAPIGLLVHLEHAPGASDDAGILRDALHEFFRNRALRARRRLRALLEVGRKSLAVGLAFLVAFIGIGDLLAIWVSGGRVGDFVRESLLIGGWVAMWRPLEIFLYDWWPIRAEARLFDRLATMPVRIKYLGTDFRPT